MSAHSYLDQNVTIASKSASKSSPLPGSLRPRIDARRLTDSCRNLAASSSCPRRNNSFAFKKEVLAISFRYNDSSVCHIFNA